MAHRSVSPDSLAFLISGDQRRERSWPKRSLTLPAAERRAVCCSELFSSLVASHSSGLAVDGRAWSTVAAVVRCELVDDVVPRSTALLLVNECIYLYSPEVRILRKLKASVYFHPERHRFTSTPKRYRFTSTPKRHRFTSTQKRHPKRHRFTSTQKRHPKRHRFTSTPKRHRFTSTRK